ncbi:MAG: TorF family putative porin [Sulfurovaceae bacterium]|nr:TorF family putative porin [Sulfurovaceae bacterium]
MKFKRLSLIAIMAMSSFIYADGDIVAAEQSDFTYSANMALTSNYVWRGLSQTSNSAAIQGGIDLGYKGFYAGTWGSNVEFSGYEASMELDLYGGYKGELAGIGYDLGYIAYNYPNSTHDLNFQEAYFGLSKNIGNLGLSGKYYLNTNAPFGLDKSDYWELDAAYNLPYDIAFCAAYGDYENYGSNYSIKFSKPIGKFTASIAYTNFNADAGLSDENHVIGAISTSF